MPDTEHRWLSVEDGFDFHVLPINDAVYHETSNCVCLPEVEFFPHEDAPDSYLFIHSSLDGRELKERSDT